MTLQEFIQTHTIPIDSLELLQQAFTHKSVKLLANTTAQDCNETLEFLGDAVLGLIITEYLVNTYTQFSEGILSKIKAHVVSKSFLFKVGTSLEIEKVLRVQGFTIDSNNVASLVADAMEALIGAIYLDKGFVIAKSFVLKHFISHTTNVIEGLHEKDYKSLLQQFTQRTFHSKPKYKVINTDGPDHRREYYLSVIVDTSNPMSDSTDDTQLEFGPTQANSKKHAEQKAAKLACEHFMNDAEIDDIWF